MITAETVFIMGAGASIPYGFPVGEKLVTNILSNLGKPEFVDPLINKGFSEEIIMKFRTKLKGSNLKSIDSFLEYQNNEVKLLGKVVIAQELSKYTKYEIIDSNDDWYKEVWNAIYTKPELIKENKVSFISFNYDLSLEHYLYNSIVSSYELSDEQAQQILTSITIIHLHGKLGVEPWDKTYNVDLDIEKEGCQRNKNNF